MTAANQTTKKQKFIQNSSMVKQKLTRQQQAQANHPNTIQFQDYKLSTKQLIHNITKRVAETRRKKKEHSIETDFTTKKRTHKRQKIEKIKQGRSVEEYR